MNKEERILNFENELNFGIETNDGTLHVLKSDVIQAVSDLLDELDQPQLTIPKSIADELKEAIGATNFESTPYSIKLDEDEYLKIWASLRHKKLSDKAYKFCRDNTRVFDAYLNPLTRDLVKVVADE